MWYYNSTFITINFVDTNMEKSCAMISYFIEYSHRVYFLRKIRGKNFYIGH